MQTTTKKLSDTNVRLTIEADEKQLRKLKDAVLKRLARTMRIPGFRQGKAPLGLVEKHADSSVLQAEFLDHAINQLYTETVQEHGLRPVAQPSVTLNKFVPFTTLELTAEVEVVGDMKLGDYKKIKMPKKPVTVTDTDVSGVLAELQQREAVKREVKRAAREGDEVVIDFKGADAKTGEPIEGAEGTDYPLLLGSNMFIPGFETNLSGMKAGEEKSFAITFPADYSVKALQKRKATFAVKAKAVREVERPKADDALAAKVGPFKSLDELKTDIKKQLQTEKEYQADREYTDALLTKITNESKVAIPDSLVNEQLDRMTDEQRRNAVYRGMTWQEFLQDRQLTEDAFREQLRPDALFRVKAGLVLGAIADQEGITLSREELDTRIDTLKRQYSDPQMRAELDKTETRREIASRMISEKTADTLVRYASAGK